LFMDSVVNLNLEARHASDPRPEKTSNNSRYLWLIGALFAGLLAAQAIGFLALGTGRAGLGLSECLLVLHGLLAIVCAWVAFRRAQSIAALFWFLFIVVLVVLLLPTAVQAYDTLFGQAIVSESTRSLLYALYGAPVLMMLFLPETSRRARVKSEIFLDLFQVAIVIGLIYSTFFFLPARRMQPADALMHNVNITDAQSLLLLFAALIRLQFARVPATRSLLVRLAIFLLVCAVATLVGDSIYLQYSAKPAPEPQSPPEPASFLNFLGTNLVLLAMLSCNALLMDRWKHVYGGILTNVAIALSLFALTLRLALTQFHQQQEISQRRAAQQQLTTSHQKIGLLLDSARRQTAEVTLISELGSLLQACASREEIFRLVPERLRRLFPSASGSVSLLSASKNRLDTAAAWGSGRPADQIFTPEQCWALRRGCAHPHPGGRSDLRCAHLLGDGPSVCIPLIANGEAIGILAIQDNDVLSPIADLDIDFEAFTRRRQLAATVAEHIAVAVANLNLRESLRLEAVRDPLTHLYNRRYMQEFLDRELHSARRKIVPSRL
jgi:GAF domain